MSKIPPLTSLRTEDYPAEQRAWLPRLFLPLNQFLTAVTNCLNGRVEFGLNIPAVTQALNFVYDGTSTKIPWSLSGQPSFVWIGQAFENGAAFVCLSSMTYDASASLVYIDFAKASGDALTVGNSYKIVVRIVP